ncbi:unnamed protein product [Caenorhabditis angaria]|uniref:Seven TM Receptor n=1 Tax=Caenorhabditis angaria TaxID=860376 RepID=A0A9P1IW93_9PELO|nr:unnamed protein product [Caenorhabditis angaria]
MINRNIVTNLQTCCAGTSIFLNAILIFLIIKKSPEHLGSYRFFMIYMAILEIIYSVADFLISPQFVSHGSTFLIIFTKTNYISDPNVLLILGCIYCGFFGSFMFLFAIQFIYRFFVVTRSKKLETFNDYRIIFWFLTPVLLGAIWGTLAYLFMNPSIKFEEAEKVLIEKIDLPMDKFVYIGATFYQNDGLQKHVVIETLLMISFKLALMAISFVCIIYFASRTFLRLRALLSLTSQRNSRIQFQTFYALVTQAVIPITLMHFPCTIVLVASVFDFELGYYGGICAFTSALFPAIDPLPVMLIIQNYRGTLLNVINAPAGIFRKRAVSINK